MNTSRIPGASFRAFFGYIYPHLARGAHRYYAVAKGRTPGVYQSWDECSHQICGFPNSVYKGFRNAGEAIEYIKRHNTKQFVAEGAQKIYTDGSLLRSNGSTKAAVGVYYEGRNEDEYVSKCVELGEDKNQTTSNRAEIIASIIALESYKGQKENIVVYTDSSYVVNGANEFNISKKNAQMNIPDKVSNKDLWIGLGEAIRNFQGSVTFCKVKGHARIEGNELAHKLANQALKK